MMSSQYSGRTSKIPHSRFSDSATPLKSGILKIKSTKHIDTQKPSVQVMYAMRKLIDRSWYALQSTKLSKDLNACRIIIFGDFKYSTFFAARSIYRMSKSRLTTYMQSEAEIPFGLRKYILSPSLKPWIVYDVLHHNCGAHFDMGNTQIGQQTEFDCVNWTECFFIQLNHSIYIYEKRFGAWQNIKITVAWFVTILYVCCISYTTKLIFTATRKTALDATCMLRILQQKYCLLSVTVKCLQTNIRFSQTTVTVKIIAAYTSTQ